MVLSDDLLDTQGQTLLPKDTALTRHMIDSMERHGLSSAPIVVGELSPEEEAARRRHAEARLTRLFRLPAAGRADELLRAWMRAYRLGEEA